MYIYIYHIYKYIFLYIYLYIYYIKVSCFTNLDANLRRCAKNPPVD